MWQRHRLQVSNAESRIRLIVLLTAPKIFAISSVMDKNSCRNFARLSAWYSRLGGAPTPDLGVSVKYKIIIVILSVVEGSSVAKNCKYAPYGWMFRQAQHDRVGHPHPIGYNQKQNLSAQYFKITFCISNIHIYIFSQESSTKTPLYILNACMYTCNCVCAMRMSMCACARISRICECAHNGGESGR